MIDKIKVTFKNGKEVEFSMPQWADDRNIFMTAGIEGLAIKPSQEHDIYVKTDRCVRCGKCCAGFEGHEKWCIPIVSGQCVHLKPELSGDRVCNIGSCRPWACCIDYHNVKTHPECNIIMEKVE